MSGSVYIPSLDPTSGQGPTSFPWNYGSGQIPNPYPPIYTDWSCGYVDLGRFPLNSGEYICGHIAPMRYYCAGCGKHTRPENYEGWVYFMGIPTPHFAHGFCVACANYRPELNRFETREDWLRESSPLESGTPCCILADWFEEQGRYQDAQWLREHRSGR